MELKFLKKTSKKGFSILAGINRPISPSHVSKLCASIENMGVIRPVVVATFDFLDGKDTMYIIDGQHLFTACLRLGIDIPYVEIDVNNVIELVEKIALLNASSKSWTLQDYITSWKTVNKDYQTLESLYQRYDLELGQVAQLLHNGVIQHRNHTISRIIKKGLLSIKNITAAEHLLDQITDALSCVPRMDRVSNSAFVTAFSMYSSTKGYNHQKTIKFLKQNASKLKFSTQDPEEFNQLFHQINEN